MAGHGQEQAVTEGQGDLVDQSWLTDGISAVDTAGPSTGTSQSSWASVPADRAWSGYTSAGGIPVANGTESETIRSGPVDRRSGKRSFDQLDQSSSSDPNTTITTTTTTNSANTTTGYTDASTSATPSSVGRSVWSNDWLDLTPPGRDSKKPRTGASLSLVPVDLGFQDLGNLLAETSERKELSRSLVNTYLAVFHAQYPLLDPHLLRRKFDAAGQDPERLAPTEQVTFACIEAWAARSSLHPAVLRSKKGGPLFIEQAMSPERVDYDAMSPLPNERAAVGRSRIPVCQALKDRALRLLDTHGIMRRPSLEGLKSLLLLSNLMMGEIPKGWEEGQDAEMDREMLKSTIAEQIKLLHRHNRLVTTDRAAIQETHRVVFAAWIQDAFTAATTGVQPLLPAGLLSEITASIEQSGSSPQGAILPRVESETRFHVAFRLGWIESGQIARYIAKFISQPILETDSDRNLDDFIEAVETTWRASVDGQAALRSRCAEAMDLISIKFFPATCVYQWIMTYVTQIVLLTSASCIVHGWITARRTTEQNRKSGAQIHSESAESTPEASPHSPRGDLERLYERSAMEVLKSVVDFVPVLRSAIPLNLLRNPSPNLLTLTALAEAATSIPTEEQGLNVGSLEGVRWRNAEKGETLSVYREALSQCTSSWSRVQDDVDALDGALAKMALRREVSEARDDTIERLLCYRV
ncbi:hypothetical protein HD553DRAFT_320516 [Filobasidium floriforme]|uniref:uncharacterized protein n=1 Tax=Filobasidium floriforme TaxID=5210 RepID=UPI001E8DB8BE|nr:uncharacterized protein HD553DRAFT_320516 [Filobasidium floriforme]KAH8077864.1 hypothetical protein HD553DRAFT_320516 [Filobasidium floriforme]